MGFSWTLDDIEGSDTLTADHVSSAENALVNFINKGIRRTELRTDGGDYDGFSLNKYSKQGWVRTEHIFKPEFYGSPSPRMDAVSGHTHFRETNNDFSKSVIFQGDVSGSDYIPVPGLCTRIKLHHKAFVLVHVSFYAYELGGVAKTCSKAHADGENGTLPYAGYHGKTAADFRLKINGSKISSTKRKVFVSTLEPWPAPFGDSNIGTDETSDYGGALETSDGWAEPSGPITKDNQLNDGQLFFNMLSRHQHFLTYTTELEAGIHDIGMACKPTAQTGTILVGIGGFSGQDDSVNQMKSYGVEPGDIPEFKNRKHIFVVARNLVVDTYYYETDS